MSTAEIITFSIIGFFALLAILTFLRLLLRKGPPHWLQFRVGVYIERVPNNADGDEYPPKPLPPKQ